LNASPASCAVLAALCLAASCAAGAQHQIPAEWFACRTGEYRFLIADHYPALFNIGWHKVQDIGQRQQGSETIRTRRFEYIGMTLEVAVSSLNPERYTLLRAEVWSRRWNIGRLSVGRRPWQSSSEKTLAGVALNGQIELRGSTDRATLQLRDGQVERVTFECQPTPSK